MRGSRSCWAVARTRQVEAPTIQNGPNFQPRTSRFAAPPDTNIFQFSLTAHLRQWILVYQRGPARRVWWAGFVHVHRGIQLKRAPGVPGGTPRTHSEVCPPAHLARSRCGGVRTSARSRCAPRRTSALSRGAISPEPEMSGNERKYGCRVRAICSHGAMRGKRGETERSLGCDFLPGRKWAQVDEEECGRTHAVEIVRLSGAQGCAPEVWAVRGKPALIVDGFGARAIGCNL
jgi:hypothetical protein